MSDVGGEREMERDAVKSEQVERHRRVRGCMIIHCRNGVACDVTGFSDVPSQ